MAHGAALRVLSKNPYVADQVVADHRHAELTSRERAIVDFAVTVTREPAAVEEADLERLRAHGLADADIWDVGAVAAFAIPGRLRAREEVVTGAEPLGEAA